MARVDTSLSGGVGASWTLLDVHVRIERGGLPPRIKRNCLSALRTIERMADRPLDRIPLTASAIRELLTRRDWGAFGLTRRHWANIRSLVRRAIQESDLPFASLVCPEPVPLTEDWRAIVAAAPSAQARSCLTRLARFCSARQLPPRSVENGTVEAFAIDLAESQIAKHPERVARDAISFWNRVIVPGFGLPRLSSRGRREIYVLPWSAFPETLEEEANRFYRETTGEDLFEGVERPVRVSTATQRHRMIRRFASLLVRQGVDAASLSDLGQLFHPDQVKRALTGFVERGDGKPTQQAFDMATLAVAIAQWRGFPEDDLKRLVGFRAKIRPDRRGLTQRNQDRLAPFTDPKILKRLIALPTLLARQAEAMEPGPKAALLMQKAMAIAILLFAPIRILNLRTLEWDRHLIPQMRKKKRGLILSIRPEEVKNEMPLTFPLPDHLAALLDRYRHHFQPMLTGGESRWVFLGKNGKQKSENALRRLIKETIERELGLIINPHLFRHLAALIVLTHFPGQYETVRRLLGHKSLNTTTQSYVGFEMTPASEQLNGILARLLEEEAQ